MLQYRVIPDLSCKFPGNNNNDNNNHHNNNNNNNNNIMG
jgi:hypothetical protein